MEVSRIYAGRLWGQVPQAHTQAIQQTVVRQVKGLTY
jgi:hypothetical protein